MLDGMAGKVFHGRVHPTEIAQRLVREADLASTDHATGPMVPNAATVILNPGDLELPPATLTRVLTEAFEAHAAEEGWRLPGPTYVSLKLDQDIPPGSLQCRLETRRGPRHPWGRLSGTDTVDLSNNRMFVGRSADCDVVLPYDEVSRMHALIVRRHGSVWITDLGSANGTHVDGISVGDEPCEFHPGSVITIADRSFRLEIA
jgi:hypothetical protein